jgi:hypothetical protein
LSCSLAALALRLTAEDGGSTGKTFRFFRSNDNHAIN